MLNPVYSNQPPPPHTKDNSRFSAFFKRFKKIGTRFEKGLRDVVLFSTARADRSGLSAAPKKFGCVVPLQIGGSHPRALLPRRWGKQKGRSEQSNCIGYFPFSPAAPKFFGRAARRVPSPSGRTLLEMLAVLAIIGVLSITALVGFTYAMNKHRANETIHDVMLRGTNVPMIDEYYYDKASGYEFRFPGLVNNGRQGTYYPMMTKKDAGSSYYVEATGVTYRVCELILKMNPTDIDQIVVNNSVYTGDSNICGNTDGLAMKFCFGSDGTICDGTGNGGSSGGNTSGGSGTGSGSGSGSGTQDCTLSKDCTGTLVCIAGTCQEPEPNTPCVDDADCPGDQACTSGTCQKPNSCTTSADCDGNLTCTEDGECKNPNPCTLSKDCTGTLVCIAGTCQKPDPNTPCVDDTDCPGDQACTSGTCQKPNSCTTSADCEGNLTCTEDGECKNPEPCSIDTDCPGEQICTEGTCTDPECTIESDCPDLETCTEGRCEPKPCTDNSTCGRDGCCINGTCSDNCTCEDGYQMAPDGTCINCPIQNLATGNYYEICVVNGAYACCCVGGGTNWNVNQDGSGHCTLCEPPKVFDGYNDCKCENGNDCGATCCTEDETCINGSSCCAAAQVCENEMFAVCCSDGETCVNGSCCSTPNADATECCAYGVGTNGACCTTNPATCSNGTTTDTNGCQVCEDDWCTQTGRHWQDGVCCYGDCSICAGKCIEVASNLCESVSSYCDKSLGWRCSQEGPYPNSACSSGYSYDCTGAFSYTRPGMEGWTSDMGVMCSP